MSDNIDYLKLAKATLDSLRDVTNDAHPRMTLLEVGHLAVQIAQVEATEWVAFETHLLAKETHLNWCANDPHSYDLPFDDPPEEDTGEDCVHGVNVGSECVDCDVAMNKHFDDGFCVCTDCDAELTKRQQATTQSINDRSYQSGLSLFEVSWARIQPFADKMFKGYSATRLKNRLLRHFVKGGETIEAMMAVDGLDGITPDKFKSGHERPGTKGIEVIRAAYSD